MEISLEEKQNNIRRITNTVDFGLGMTQAVSNIEELPSRRKREVCLFRFDDLNSPTFAYRLIKDARKLREYPSCMEYRSEDIGYPTIRYFNEASSEVVTDWIVGDNLAYFDRPKRLQPKVGPDELTGVMYCLMKMHKHTSTCFSNVELVPRTHRLATGKQLSLPHESYYPRIVESYGLVFESIDQARHRSFVSMDEYRSIKNMADQVSEVLEGSRNLFSNFGHFSLLHGDVHAENIIKTPNSIRLIDFENMHYGDRAVEIAYFLEHCSQAGFINQEKVDPLVDQYLELLADNCPGVIDKNFKDRFRVLRAYLTVKLLGMLSNGYTTGDQNGVNRTLFEDVLSRSRVVLASL